MDSIHNDAEALCNHGGLTRNNLLLIEDILKNPSRDYEIGGGHAPPAYNLSNEAQNPSVPKRLRAMDSPPVPVRAKPSFDSPSVPARPRPSVDSPPVPQRPRPSVDSGSQYPGSKWPEKPARPVAPANNEKLSSQYRQEQEKKQEANDSKKNQYASKVGNQVVMSGASGVGWGVGMGIARRLI